MRLQPRHHFVSRILTGTDSRSTFLGLGTCIIINNPYAVFISQHLIAPVNTFARTLMHRLLPVAELLPAKQQLQQPAHFPYCAGRQYSAQNVVLLISNEIWNPSWWKPEATYPAPPSFSSNPKSFAYWLKVQPIFIRLIYNKLPTIFSEYFKQFQVHLILYGLSQYSTATQFQDDTARWNHHFHQLLLSESLLPTKAFPIFPF